MRFTRFLLLILKPLVCLCSRHSLDVLLSVDGLSATVYVKEILAVSSLIKSLLITCGIAKVAVCALLYDLGCSGIVLNLANNLLHFGSPFIVYNF